MTNNKKYLKPVGIELDTCLDADDLGQRLVDCIRQIDANANVVNLIKIHVGKHLTKEMFPTVIEENIIKPLNEMGATNCIFVPLLEGFIEDITVDHIEVCTE